MSKKYKNYDIIKTDDGSETLFSKIYGEACHSTSGAVDETRLHYIKGCQIAQKLKQNESLNILEVGFGTGIGFIETYEASKEFRKKIKFVSFEIDKELLDIFENKYHYKFEHQNNTAKLILDHIELIIYIGNARDNINLIKDKFHAIYQDAFSPKKNADLWTTQWFDDLKHRSYSDCIMSTYSASSSIRKSMIKAGWILYNGENFGTKRSSTRARLTGAHDDDILEQLKRSPAPEITDDNYQDYQKGLLT